MTNPIPDTSQLKPWEYPKIAERFYRETRRHELKVLHDTKDGYRHLRMMAPRHLSSAYWYEIVTWEGNLVFRGDGTSFVFSIFGKDMFTLFREGLREDGLIRINATYWSEKLSSNRDVKEFDADVFSKYVTEYLKDSEEAYPGLTEAWTKATDGWMTDYDIHHEQGAWEAVQRFSYGERHFAKCSCGAMAEEEESWEVKSWARENGHTNSLDLPRPGHHVEFTHRDPFVFDPIDMDFKDYDWWFLWALYGIVRAIGEYDRYKGQGPAQDIASTKEVALS